MFIISELCDTLKVASSTKSKEEELHKILNKKYVGNLIEPLGQAVLIYKLIQVQEYKLVEDYLAAKVVFQVVFFRFYSSEIIVGKILRQTERGIDVSIPFFKRFRIPEEYMPDGCEKTAIIEKNERKFCWVWVYKENRLFYSDSEDIRFRIASISWSNLLVTGRIDDAGLGPISWWL